MSQLFRRSGPVAMPLAWDWEYACNLHEFSRRGVSNPGVMNAMGYECDRFEGRGKSKKRQRSREKKGSGRGRRGGVLLLFWTVWIRIGSGTTQTRQPEMNAARSGAAGVLAVSLALRSTARQKKKVASRVGGVLSLGRKCANVDLDGSIWW